MNELMKTYYMKKRNNEKVTVESLIKEKKLTRSDLIEIAKENSIYYNCKWTKKQMVERIVGSMERIIYARECCSCRSKEESKHDFYIKRIIITYLDASYIFLITKYTR